MVTDTINQQIVLPVITNQNHSVQGQKCLAEIFNLPVLRLVFRLKLFLYVVITQGVLWKIKCIKFELDQSMFCQVPVLNIYILYYSMKYMCKLFGHNVRLMWCIGFYCTQNWMEKGF